MAARIFAQKDRQLPSGELLTYYFAAVSVDELKFAAINRNGWSQSPGARTATLLLKYLPIV